MLHHFSSCARDRLAFGSNTEITRFMNSCFFFKFLGRSDRSIFNKTFRPGLVANFLDSPRYFYSPKIALIFRRTRRWLLRVTHRVLEFASGHGRKQLVKFDGISFRFKKLSTLQKTSNSLSVFYFWWINWHTLARISFLMGTSSPER